MAKQDKKRLQALKAITALRQLEALKLLNKEEISSIEDKITASYGKYLSPLRTEFVPIPLRTKFVPMTKQDEKRCIDRTKRDKSKTIKVSDIK